jgi:Pyruvate/2-oxoglutarate dehydrogenase complex, dihydrolipoamide acyltransferase (E2) component, and related enzymes
MNEDKDTMIPVAETNDLPAEKINILRKSIAKNMTKSWETSPMVTYTRPVDATQMKAFRNEYIEAFKEKGAKLTFNYILMKVCAQVLMEMPDVNASYADRMITHHKHANVGLAVAKGDGLIVPNIKSTEEKTLFQVAAEMEALIEKTRKGRIELEEVKGGTFTISSLGAYGITSFSPIINQPELAILGVCDIVDTPVGENGQIVLKPMMNLSITADHRIIDGVMAATFLQRIAELLEKLPETDMVIE